MNFALSPSVLPSRKTIVITSIVLLALIVMMTAANAGTTGLEFKALYEQIMGWAKGYLGKIFAVAAFLIGAGFSAARQSPMPAIFGLVLALVIGFGPALIESVLAATV